MSIISSYRLRFWENWITHNFLHKIKFQREESVKSGWYNNSYRCSSGGQIGINIIILLLCYLNRCSRAESIRNENKFQRDRRKTRRRKIWTRLRITHLARILGSFPVTGAHHLVVDYNVYAVGLVPPLALSVVNDWYVDGLERLRPQSRTCVAKNTQKQQTEQCLYYRQIIIYYFFYKHFT